LELLPVHGLTGVARFSRTHSPDGDCSVTLQEPARGMLTLCLWATESGARPKLPYDQASWVSVQEALHKDELQTS
jgi:hypothetical protein